VLSSTTSSEQDVLVLCSKKEEKVSAVSDEKITDSRYSGVNSFELNADAA